MVTRSDKYLSAFSNSRHALKNTNQCHHFDQDTNAQFKMERRTARFTDLVGQIDYVWFGQIALTKCCCILSKKVKMCIAHKNVKLCIGRKKEMRISAGVTSCTSSFNSRWKLCHQIWKLLRSYHLKFTLKDFNC